MADMIDVSRCGEEHGQFYDRRGYYFREGIDPRNHYGRFVHHGCEHKRQPINIYFTCSDYVHHEHRWRWTAWLCGRLQYVRFQLNDLER